MDFESTPAYQKGLIGEEIVKRILKSWGASITRPDNSAKSLVDFHVKQKTGKKSIERYVEVKAKDVMKYAHGHYPCYSFPVVKIEAYENFAAEKKSHVELWIVDSEIGEIIVGSLDDNEIQGLERKRHIDGKEFPFDQETKYGKYRFFHRKQFGLLCSIAPADLVRLRAIKIDTNESNTANKTSPVIKQSADVAVLAATDIEDIGTRADSIVKVFDIPRKDALRTAIKLKSQELGRDLTPLLELLDRRLKRD